MRASPFSLLFSSSKKQRRTSYGFYSLVVPPPRTPLSSPSNRPRRFSLSLSFSPRLKPRTNNARLAVEMVTLVLVRCRFVRQWTRRGAHSLPNCTRVIPRCRFFDRRSTRSVEARLERERDEDAIYFGPGWNFEGVLSAVKARKFFLSSSILRCRRESTREGPLLIDTVFFEGDCAFAEG